MKDQKTIIEQIQNNVGNLSRDIWLAGLGMVSVAQEEGQKLIERAEKEGKSLIERAETEGKKLYERAEKEGTRIKNDFAKQNDELIKAGKGLEKKAKDFADEKRSEVKETVSSATETVEGRLAGMLESLGISFNNDVKDLNEKVDKLTKTVNKLSREINAKTKAKAKK